MLVRIDGAGGTNGLIDWLTGRRLSYSVGFTLPGSLSGIQARLSRIPDRVWQPAYDADGQVRNGAWVAEVTGLFDLSSWPAGMRVIVGKKRPHPGAQLRITDLDGMRVTAFATTAAAPSPIRSCATSPGPGRRPHPRFEGHRTTEPAATRL